MYLFLHLGYLCRQILILKNTLIVMIFLTAQYNVMMPIHF